MTESALDHIQQDICNSIGTRRLRPDVSGDMNILLSPIGQAKRWRG